MHRQLNEKAFTERQLLALVHESLQSLGWNITLINSGGMVAKPFNNLVFVYRFENKPLVSCTYENTEESAYTYEPEKVLSAFERKFNELSLQLDANKLDSVFKTISKLFKTESSNPADDSWLKTILAIIIPSKENFAGPLLLFVNISIFILMVISGAGFFEPGTGDILNWGGNYRRLTLDGEWWRLITCNFVHIGFFHLAMNMYALIFVAIYLEPIIGRTKFAFGYLLTGVAASLASLWWNTNTISAGASGAIFGLYGIFFALLLTNFIERQARMTLLTSIGIFIVYNLAGGVKTGVDNAAHIGGLAAGIVIGFIYFLSLMLPGNKIVSGFSVLIPTLIVAFLSLFMLSHTDNPIKQYDDNMAAFSRNENTAINAMKKYNSVNDRAYLTLIADSSLALWKQNLNYLNELNGLHLPDYLKYRNALLGEYAALRIEETSWIYVSIERQTNEYDAKIDSIQTKINKVLQKINAEE